MTHNGEALSRLRGITLGNLTLEQMDAVLGSTTLTPATADALEEGAIVAAGMSAQRTYANGNLPIPEQSVIIASAIAAGESHLLQPTGTEIFNVIGIEVVAAAGTPSVSVLCFNGSASCLLHTGSSSTTASSFFPWETPFPLTNTAYLRVDNADLSNPVTVTIAYHKVSL